MENVLDLTQTTIIQYLPKYSDKIIYYWDSKNNLLSKGEIEIPTFKSKYLQFPDVSECIKWSNGENTQIAHFTTKDFLFIDTELKDLDVFILDLGIWNKSKALLLPLKYNKINKEYGLMNYQYYGNENKIKYSNIPIAYYNKNKNHLIENTNTDKKEQIIYTFKGNNEISMPILLFLYFIHKHFNFKDN